MPLLSTSAEDSHGRIKIYGGKLEEEGLEGPAGALPMVSLGCFTWDASPGDESMIFFSKIAVFL